MAEKVGTATLYDDGTVKLEIDATLKTAVLPDILGLFMGGEKAGAVSQILNVFKLLGGGAI